MNELKSNVIFFQFNESTPEAWQGWVEAGSSQSHKVLVHNVWIEMEIDEKYCTRNQQ